MTRQPITFTRSVTGYWTMRIRFAGISIAVPLGKRRSVR